MKKRIISLILASVLLTSLVGCTRNHGNNSSSSGELPEINTAVKVGDLVKDGKSDYTIVYDENCGAAVKNAANQLQTYVEQATGSRLPVVADNNISPSGNQKFISLGRTEFFEGVRADTDYNGLGKDGFFIKTTDGNIVIDGNTDRGVLYGAYDFLEKIIGIKFLAHDYTYVPKLSEVALYEMNIYEVPAFANRAYLSRHIMYNQEFTSHMRMNNEFVDLREEWGGLFEFQPEAVHTTCDYVDPSIYYEEHKDWYYVAGGKVADLCYSHVGLTEDGELDPSLEISPVTVAAAHLVEMLLDSEYDAYYYFGLGQEDRYAGDCCLCEDCIAQAEMYGRSGMVIRFVNAVLRKAQATLASSGVERDFGIVTLMYQWSEQAPWDIANDKAKHPSVYPEDEIYLRLCTINAQNYYSMMDPMQIDSVKRIFNYWPKLTDNFMLWTYNTDYEGFFIYYPTVQTFSENFRLYQEIGFEYVMLQASVGQGTLWQDDMNTYVASKLLWDPSLDAETVKQEYIHYFYADAAEYITRFIDCFDMQYAVFTSESYPESERPNLWTYTREVLNSKYWSIPFWEHQFELLDQAEAAIENAEETEEWKLMMKKRINAVRLTPQYMIAEKYEDYYGVDTLKRKAFLDEMFNNIASLGISMYTEKASITQLKYSLGY